MTSKRCVYGFALLLYSCGSVSLREGLLKPERVAQVDCIAVLPFENSTPDPSAGELVAEEIATRLFVSERYNVLQPREARHLMGLLGKPQATDDSLTAALAAGKTMGVHAVLVGRVSAFEERDLSPRLPNAEPVAAFTARLVDVQDGSVLWTTSTTNIYAPSGIVTSSTREAVLREAVDASLEQLVDARGAVATRGLCAASYVTLKKKPIIAVAALSNSNLGAPLPDLPPGSNGALPDMPSGLPAMPPGSNGSLPSLPPDAGMSRGGGLPALPPEGGLPALPPDSGLPPMPLDSGLPPMPSDGGLPALPPDGGLPALPDDSGLPALPGGAPPPAGGVPPVLLGKLPPKAKVLAKQLYKPAPVELPLATPGTGKATLSAKTKRSLDQLAGVLRAAPTMHVVIGVHVDPKGKAPDATVLKHAQDLVTLATAYLKKSGVDPTRAKLEAHGRGQPVAKRGAPANTRFEVVVVQYP